MRITIHTEPQRKRPRAGDIRTTKAYGVQVRIPDRTPCGALVVSYGRQCFIWVSPAEAETAGYGWLLPPELRSKGAR